MTFDSPREYADHLSTIIEDEDVVLLAVRRKFPDYGYSIPAPKRKAPVSRVTNGTEFKEGGAKKPGPDAPWLAEAYDRIDRQRIEEGSTKLLSALWNAHPRILQHLGAAHP